MIEKQESKIEDVVFKNVFYDVVHDMNLDYMISLSCGINKFIIDRNDINELKDFYSMVFASSI